MDNLFVVVEEYDNYQFKESKVIYSQLYTVVADVECVIIRIINTVLLTGGDIDGAAGACLQTPLD